MRPAAALLVLLLPACLEVQKVDPGPYYIDDFEDGNLDPLANPFGTWGCAPVGPDGDGGAPEDPDGGIATPPADGGSSVNCQPVVSDGDRSCCSLSATFNLLPGASGHRDQAWVFTNAKRDPVDFTRFQKFWFSSILEAPDGLPSGTQLFVELGCSKVQALASPAATSPPVSFVIGSGWKSSFVSLADFNQTGSRTNQDCLVKVDSVRFIVDTGLGAQPAIGTLHIDTVYLVP
jgi:hypothetical protein